MDGAGEGNASRRPTPTTGIDGPGRCCDEAGNLTTTTDALENATVSTYVEASQLVAVTYPLSNTTTYTHDDAGRKTTETDPLSNTMCPASTFLDTSFPG